MKARFALAAAVAALVAAGIALDSWAQSVDVVAGRIISVHCEAHLQKKAQADVKLSAPRDVALGLSAGDRVRCIGTGYMEVLVSDGTKRIEASQNWFPIPPLAAHAIAAGENTLIADALGRYGISGATRGGPKVGSRILWPAEGSAVMPEHFVIRWMPAAQKITLSLLSQAKDVTLWGPAEVEANANSLDSQVIASALTAYKKKAASAGVILTLALAGSSDWEEVHFSLLTAREEKDLNSQLDFWAKNADGLALHLGRGYSFQRHKLYSEAADEYDAALNSASESPYLLQDAIDANFRAGRLARMKELQARLAAQPKGDNP